MTATINTNQVNIDFGEGEWIPRDDDVVDIDVTDGSVDNVITAGNDVAIDMIRVMTSTSGTFSTMRLMVPEMTRALSTSKR